MKFASFKGPPHWIWQAMPTKVNQRFPGRALQALRVAAGFDSAAAAASRYNWSPSRYASHESGARPILKEDAKQYAAAYGVEVAKLQAPDPVWLEELQEKADTALWARKRQPAVRLAAARI